MLTNDIKNWLDVGCDLGYGYSCLGISFALSGCSCLVFKIYRQSTGWCKRTERLGNYDISSFSALTLLLGDRKGIRPVKILSQQSTKVLWETSLQAPGLTGQETKVVLLAMDIALCVIYTLFSLNITFVVPPIKRQNLTSFTALF